MTSSFVVYIDESGDEGFSFDRGSSKWFVLSAVITRKSEDLETVKLIDEAKILLNREPNKKPLHFRDLKHEQKLPLLELIKSRNLKIANVLIHKPSLKNAETFKSRYKLYFYSVRYLLERVSWYCRDNRLKNDSGDGSTEIIFSNRSGMSYEELRNYIEKLKHNNSTRIYWNSIESKKITAYSPGKRMGLQIADATATSVFKSVEKSNYGFTEDRYIKMLKPVIYERNGKYESYGIKIFPNNSSITLESFDWFSHFK